jgi:hypothetical protein
MPFRRPQQVNADGPVVEPSKSQIMAPVMCMC